MTSGTTSRQRSTRLANAPDRIRTCDLRFRTAGVFGLIDHYRRQRSVAERPVGRDEGSLDPELRGAVEPDERGLGPDPDLHRAHGSLTDREREVIALRFGGDLTGPEIAELTGLSLANVQQILSRSLRRLRAELERADAPDALERSVVAQSRSRPRGRCQDSIRAFV
jgi:DNA-binding CsgD family transcriptional regulator